jgi:hypothetical protein
VDTNNTQRQRVHHVSGREIEIVLHRGNETRIARWSWEEVDEAAATVLVECTRDVQRAGSLVKYPGDRRGTDHRHDREYQNHQAVEELEENGFPMDENTAGHL